MNGSRSANPIPQRRVSYPFARRCTFVPSCGVPVRLGGDVPSLPAPAARHQLELTGHRTYPSGIVLPTYAVQRRLIAVASLLRGGGTERSTDRTLHFVRR